MTDFVLRNADVNDQAAIRGLHQQAFGRPDEADLVDRLGQEGAVLLSLVAEWRKEIAGHILFTRMWIDHAHGSIAAVALAPVAVLPARQGQGIGGHLIRAGLIRLREQSERIVLVLGHADYYARFGFSTAMARGLESPFPPEAFMATELSPDALAGIYGRVRYPLAFGL